MNVNDFSNQAKSLWAKKRTTDGKQLWLPLVVHLKDTEATINWLLNHWLSASQIELLTQQFDLDELQKLVKLTGFIHDLGKASPVFQRKQSYDGHTSIDAELLEQLERAGFAGITTASLTFPKASPHNLAGEAILNTYGVPDSIAAIVGGHHGRPLANKPDQDIGNFTANYWQTDLKSTIQIEWQKVQREIFEFGLRDAGYESVQEIPSVNLPQSIIIEGLLIMSDWLSSSEYLESTNQPMFSLVPLETGVDSIDIQARFRNAMSTWKQHVGEWNPQTVSLQNDPYTERWGFKAHPIQIKITQAISETVDPGMIVIEAPMGIGKTEIALVAAEQLAVKTGKTGLYFGLPTQATSNAMFARVNNWLEFVKQTQVDNLSIELMHGKRQFNAEFQDLPRASEINSSDKQDNAVVVNEWFSGKKTILDEFTVGTIDNLLRLSLKQKHLALRHLGLSKKVVILDEIHAGDAYMDSYLYRAVQWLGAYHVPVVALSATLPKAKRKSLLNAYYRGKYGKDYKAGSNDDSSWQNQEAYPLVTFMDGSVISTLSEFGNDIGQKQQNVKITRLNLPEAELMKRITASICTGGVAGVIVNTVKRAQKLAQLVPQDIPVMVLHSAFLATDRAHYEEQLQKVIGKNASRPNKMIVIGTQVLEQSLDIDFDVLFTDIAPMDLLLQRAGRLHRHDIVRPDNLKQPQIFVMGIESFGEYGSGNEGIYAKYILMKTDENLGDTIILPNDISHLVQKVYSDSTSENVSALSEPYNDYRNQIATQIEKAEVFQIKQPTQSKRANLHGWLDNMTDQSEKQANAAVRDIKETLEVVLLRRTKEGVTSVDGRKLSECADKQVAQQLVRLPTTITQYHIADTISMLERQTLKQFPDWQASVWLRGEIAVVLDEYNDATLNGYKLHYSTKLGLSFSKEEEDDGKAL